MKSAFVAILAATAALVIASTLGVASAEAPTSAPARTVSVQGVANVTIDQAANAATATSVYRQGMAAAVADGQSKAEFLTGKVGASLGSVQAVSENGGYIQCTASEESANAEYQGEQPDFGSSSPVVLPGRVIEGVAAPMPAPATHKPVTIHKPAKHGRRKAPSAKQASVTTCTLNAEVSLVYAVN